ncbi:alpha/beta hydrolase-fold protein [Pedobacter sp.]|uniref:alpha/beta hydrolase-fold protein n=1 Tax=Pedobacter sp. TaxID=1411316 RepID=UPI003BA96E70
MRRIILSAILLLTSVFGWSQDYVALGDSCFAAKKFTDAAKNYDLFLEKVESRSNMIAYRAAKSWSLAGNQEKALAAVKKYVANNYINNMVFFSDGLIKEEAFNPIKSSPEWKNILDAVIQKETLVKKAGKVKLDSILSYQALLEEKDILKNIDFKNGTAEAIYQRIRKFNAFPEVKNDLISFRFKITADLNTAFLVVLPKNYNPQDKYPLLFFLHGAVRMNTGFPDYADKRDTTGWNRFYTKYAAKNKVIMVYPMGNREYNWMTPDKGFFMVPSILTKIKRLFNIDDDKVFITGHSNGATGSFSYAIKQPAPFAGFYGFNTRPQVATGGTFLKNLLNRSFFNVSTDLDYYYPPDANDSLTKIMKALGADYQDHRYTDFPHWFPAFAESEPAHQLLFNDLITRKRNPYKQILNWECDDVKYGHCDWISITALDTTLKPKAWHKPINFEIKKWVVAGKKDEYISRDTCLKAFKYDKISGAIQANYKSNTFTINTSALKSFSIYISPEMVDISKNVKVFLNGKLIYNRKVGFEKTFIVKQFLDNIDRSALWVNHLDFTI